MAATEGKLTEKELISGVIDSCNKDQKHSVNDGYGAYSLENVNVAIEFLKNPPNEMKDIAEKFADALCLLAKKDFIHEVDNINRTTNELPDKKA